MKIFVLGATGRTGKHVIQQAIHAGYELHCLVRDPTKINFSHERLRVFQGSAEKIQDVESAIKGCEAIINVLNVSRNSDFPWSSLRTPATFLSDVAKIVIPVAEKHHIRRIVVCSAWGAAETKNDLPGWFRWLIDNSNIGYTYHDHERQEKLVMASNLLWTIVRPVGLTNLTGHQQIVESYKNNPKPRMTINRINLAKYLVDAITNEKLVKRIPVISGK
jgi:uncharacterized protein YbjT (DUF2867 family)